MVVNALSVDVEEYFHAAIFRSGTNASRHGDFESRLEASVDRLLALLDDRRTKATFFTLGEIAATHPGVVRRIAAERHEIGCHSDRHENVSDQTPVEFRADIRRAKARIENLIGAPVTGFRAPNFSIGKNEGWAYEILLEEGFRYDSSLYPILHDRYGQPDAPRFPYEIYRSGADALTEFPVGTLRLLGVNLPIGGGGYFRLSPFELIRLGIDRVNGHEHRPVMFYLHPWELDPDQPRPPMPWHLRFRHYVGLRTEATKLARLLGEFRFGTAREVLQTRACQLPFMAAASQSWRRRHGVRSAPFTTITTVDGSAARTVRGDTDIAVSWQRDVGELDRSRLAHAPEWFSVIRKAYGHDPMYLSAEDENGGRGLLPAFVVRRPCLGTVVTSMPFLDAGGPCSSSPALANLLVKRLIQDAAAAGASVVELRCTERQPLPWKPVESKVNMTLPLPADPSRLWSQLDKTVRNQIRKAERLGLSVELGGAEKLTAFYETFVVRMRDLGSPVHDSRFLRAVLHSFGDRARVALVRKGADAIGGLVALAFKDRVVVPWASCLKEYFALCPNMLLYWETIRNACAEGFRRFEFGRSTRGSGTYRFKRQWGACEEPLFWYTIPVHSRHAASMTPDGRAAAVITTAWRYLPLPVTRQLGPCIRKYLTQ